MSDWNELRLHVARLKQPDNLTDLKRRPQGADVIEVHVTVEASGLEVTTSRIPDGTPIRVSGHLEAGLNELQLHAHVLTSTEGECRRCLDPVVSDLDLELHAVFLDEADIEAESYAVDGDWVDLGAVVREELMLALPLSPLCADDCVGADPERFPTTGPTSADSDEIEHSAIDPRWAVLSDLRFDED